MSAENLPPQNRTSVWHTLTEAAGRGEFILPVCGKCQTIQYPPREICHNCLSEELRWQEIPDNGKVIACTNLNASTNAYFREHLPHRVVLVKLDCGPIIFAHAAGELNQEQRVRLLNRQDIGGSGVFVAVHENESDAQAELDRALPGLLRKQS